MENEVAFPVVHESEDELPVCIEAGEAVRVQVGVGGGGGGGGVDATVIEAEQFSCPSGPETVNV